MGKALGLASNRGGSWNQASNISYWILKFRRVYFVLVPMRRYILFEYEHGERSDAPSNATGPVDYIKDAQAYAGNRLSDSNEIVDSNTRQVVWRLIKSTASV